MSTLQKKSIKYDKNHFLYLLKNISNAVDA